LVSTSSTLLRETRSTLAEVASRAWSGLGLGVVSLIERASGGLDGRSTRADVAGIAVTCKSCRSNLTVFTRRARVAVSHSLSVLEGVVSTCRALRNRVGSRRAVVALNARNG